MTYQTTDNDTAPLVHYPNEEDSSVFSRTGSWKALAVATLLGAGLMYTGMGGSVKTMGGVAETADLTDAPLRKSNNCVTFNVVIPGGEGPNTPKGCGSTEPVCGELCIPNNQIGKVLGNAPDPKPEYETYKDRSYYAWDGNYFNLKDAGVPFQGKLDPIKVYCSQYYDTMPPQDGPY